MNLTKPQKLSAQGRSEEALSCLPDAAGSADPRVEIVRARILAAAGDLPAAIRVLEAAREARPDYAPVSLFLGTFLWDLGRKSDAEDSFRQVLGIQKENDLARSYLALCQFSSGRMESASSIWRQYGFSDNTMFRVRVAEFVELTWLLDGSFMSERPGLENSYPGGQLNTKKALSRFYRRDFAGMLKYLPEPPLTDELAAFLAATSCEMLGFYTRAREYMESLEARRDEWPDPLIALHGRLLTRKGNLRAAAEEFSKVLVVGPEDFGVNYYLGIICLAYEKHSEARQYFLRAFTSYMVDTREFQWWQIEQVLLENTPSVSTADPAVQER